MCAKIAGRPCMVPLKARTFPLDGNGDCSGKRTFAEKLPSPTSAERQASSASRFVEGLMLRRGQRGSPRVSRCPLRLISIVSFVSLGGLPALVEETFPPMLTSIGTLPRGGRTLGRGLPATETL